MLRLSSYIDSMFFVKYKDTNEEYLKIVLLTDSRVQDCTSVVIYYFHFSLPDPFQSQHLRHALNLA